MAHHVAELINEAETQTSPAQRSKAQKRATETILKIWEQRESLPSYAYPLARYDQLLMVLDRLQPDDNPFRTYGRELEPRTDQLATFLFDNFTRLIIALLLAKVNTLQEARTVDAAAIEALSDEEQRVWNIVLKWNDLFAPASKRRGRPRKSKKSAEPTEIDFTEASIRLVDAIATSLLELRDELQSAPQKSDGLVVRDNVS